MPYLLNILYLLLITVTAPILGKRMLTTGKYRRGLWRKLVGQAVLYTREAPCAWFHGVSVGEIHLLGPLVKRFRHQHPDWQCVISTTTDTGLAEATKRFPDLEVFYWPLDFSWAVKRALRRMNPSLVVLAEGELWPNFLSAADRRGVPVAVVNARMSPRSYRNYSCFRPLVRRWLAPVDLLLAQTEDYAERFRKLGVAAKRVRVTGSVKFDGAESDRSNPRTSALRRLLAVADDDLVWIAGSTQAPEEQLVLQVYHDLRVRYPGLRLILVPRQQDRFEEVAQLLRHSRLPFVRRSELSAPVADRGAVVLVDTIGELGALWGLADVAFVGGSLDGRRGGQNMIEPAAYGAAVVFGPHVWNFADTARRLIDAGGAVQVAGATGLAGVVNRLIEDADERRRLGAGARQLVMSQQGATVRSVEALTQLIRGEAAKKQAA